MDWKPNKWIAILLGFFFQPLGMLYIARAKLAVLYFLAGIGAKAADYWLGIGQAEWSQYFSFVPLLMIVCASHIYIILRSHESISSRPWYSRWYGLISFPLVATILVILMRSFLYEPFRMPAVSMSPTLNPGDSIVASKWGYGNYGTFGISLAKVPLSKILERADVVVFEYPKDRSISYVKRIIGLPGDTIEYRRGLLAVNGKEIDRDFERRTGDYELYRENLGGAIYHIKVMPDVPSVEGRVSVPDGHIFVLGDNRDNSNDSRYWGFVPFENIVGKMVHVF